jgi:hypothetical protein
VSRNLNRVFEALLSGSPTEWIVFLAAATGIAVAVWAVARFRASLRGDADPAAADAHLVRLARELRDRGEVSEDEYRSLKGRFGRAGEGDIAARTDEARGRPPT